MKDISRIMVFDIEGYMAHFRKFYTNSSALTYSFPPYTTVVGLIAGILGRPRDSYYKEFDSENCLIAVSLEAETRKIVQTMNYIRTKSKNELDGSAGPTPTPLEILLAKDSKLRFRIYFTHRNNELVDEVKKRVQEQRYVYPPYLGISEFLASLKFIDDIYEDRIKCIFREDPVKIATAINTEHIKERGIFLDRAESGIKILKEKMAVEFDEERNLKKVSSFIFEATGKEIPVFLKTPYYQIQLKKGEHKNILFLNQ